jgi:hypothetical protein
MNSSSDSRETFSGPVENHPWPEALEARVATAGPAPRIHGYDVEEDLAAHYRPTDLVLLALTGELPGAQASAAFEIASIFLAPISVAEAPAHAAVLARLSGSNASAVIGVAAIALAEQARFLVDAHLELLDDAGDDLPSKFLTTDPVESSAVLRLRRALAPTGMILPALEQGPTRDAALLLVLRACGLTRREQLEAAIVSARLPCAAAEAFAETATQFRKYPMDLPAFRYEETT